jgi:hypothetical protein
MIDIGHGYYTQRALQSEADAAALAGAQGLPDPTAATSLAQQYGGSTSGKNECANVPNVQTSVSLQCASAGASCTSDSAVAVVERAPVKTIFAQVFGINTFNVSAQATACQGGFGAAYLISDSNSSCIVAAGPCQLATPSPAAAGARALHSARAVCWKRPRLIPQTVRSTFGTATSTP